MRTELPTDLRQTPAGQAVERVLRSCVHCGMCNATCPTYQLSGDELDGPRGRIYLLKQALENNSAGAITQTHLDRCLGCRSCETTCPSGVQYHTLYDIGRELMPQRSHRSWREKMLRWGIGRVAPFPRRVRVLAMTARAVRWLLPAKLRKKAQLLAPTTRCGAARSAHPRRMLLLSGCVQSVFARQFNAATARVFDRLGIELVEVQDARCCGAVNFHLEQREAARELARHNIDLWWPHVERGAEALIVNASGCAVFLRDYPTLLADDPTYAAKAQRVAALAQDPVELLLRTRLRATARPTAPRIAVHEPCTQQHGLRLTGQVTDLLRSLGYDPQPITDAHLCCGSAGAYSLLQPDIAESLRAAKLRSLTTHAPAFIYTGNIGCWMHLREASPVSIRHWIEAVDEVAVTAFSEETASGNY